MKPRVLVVTLPEKGHYFPLLGPAEALTRQGAEVAFAVSCDIREELQRLGIERVFTPPGAAPPTGGLRGEAFARLLLDAEALRGWIGEMLVEAPGRQVDAMREIIRDFRPDVVAIDTMAYEGAIAAELEGIPWVGWATSLNPVVPDALESELLRTLRALDPARQALFAQYGLSARFRSSDVLSPLGTATFTTEELVGPPGPGVELVGPSLGGVRSGEGPSAAFGGGRPIVYVSFGSQAWYQPQRYDRVLEAAEALDLAVFAAMGDLAEVYQHRGLPDHVRCVSFAAQLDALERARVLITHGGANSVMEGLSRGVPLLIAPICNDQPHNRYFIEQAQAGRGIDLDHCTRDELIAALRALIAAGPERANARRISQSYLSRAGSFGAASMTLRAMSR